MNAQDQRKALRLAYPFSLHFVDQGKDGLPDAEPWPDYLERQENRDQPVLMARGLRPYHRCAFRDYEQARS